MRAYIAGTDEPAKRMDGKVSSRLAPVGATPKELAEETRSLRRPSSEAGLFFGLDLIRTVECMEKFHPYDKLFRR